MRIERPRGKRANKFALVLDTNELNKLNHLIECVSINSANCSIYDMAVLREFRENLLNILYCL